MAEVNGQGDVSSAATSCPPAVVASTPIILTTSKMSVKMVPSDKVRLDVLLITGQRRNFDFDRQTSIKDVREVLWTDWPQDWPPRPISYSAIRILHLGHILDDKFILSPPEATSATSSSTREMPVGKSTVVHLLLRQEPTKADGDEDSLKKATPESPGCCGCIIC